MTGTLLTKKSKLRVRFSLTSEAKVLFAVAKHGSGTALARWTQPGKAGLNSITLTRKLPTKRTLRAGRYTLVLQLASTARTASFRVH